MTVVVNGLIVGSSVSFAYGAYNLYWGTMKKAKVATVVGYGLFLAGLGVHAFKCSK